MDNLVNLLGRGCLDTCIGAGLFWLVYTGMIILIYVEGRDRLG